MIIDVAEINPPAAGRKMARLVSAAGQAYQIWPDKLGRVHIGGRYEIETRDREWEGRTYVSIIKIEPAEPPAAGANSSHLPAAPMASPRVDEAEYVGRVLAALIAAGQVDRDSVADMTDWLVTIWRHTDVPY